MAKTDAVRQPTRPNAKGLGAAVCIIGAWAASLVLLLGADLSQMTWQIGVGVAVQTFLYTGLFITAHDAMHGTVAPDFPRLNRAVGAVAVGLYALFSFKHLKKEHWRHHDHPATEEDPDFHDGDNDGVIRWYLRFMTTYVTVVQLIGMAVVFNVLQYLVGIPASNLVVFWVAPALLSTVQLFYFGTVLPHRRPEQGYADEHRAQSNDFSPLLSFLTCYHFGYHWEHHERPDLPWWYLPRFRRWRRQHTTMGRDGTDSAVAR